MTLSGVTRREKAGRSEILGAGSLRIETFEGSRPQFGGAIAYWVLNRERDTQQENVATRVVTCTLTVVRRIAVALPNTITRSVRRSAASF